MKSLYISNKNDLEQQFIDKGWSYKFFDYSYFNEHDDIISMWQRIVYVCSLFQPDIIILNFKHPQMINSTEHETLSKLAVVIIQNG